MRCRHDRSQRSTLLNILHARSMFVLPDAAPRGVLRPRRHERPSWRPSYRQMRKINRLITVSSICLTRLPVLRFAVASASGSGRATVSASARCVLAARPGAQALGHVAVDHVGTVGRLVRENIWHRARRAFKFDFHAAFGRGQDRMPRTSSFSRGANRIRCRSVPLRQGQGCHREPVAAVAPGENSGVVGRSGAGKSTLVNLLLCFYDREGGRILIRRAGHRRGDAGFAKCPHRSSRRTPRLLHRSVRENIHLRPPRRDQRDDAGGGRAGPRPPTSSTASPNPMGPQGLRTPMWANAA